MAVRWEIVESCGEIHDANLISDTIHSLHDAQTRTTAQTVAGLKTPLAGTIRSRFATPGTLMPSLGGEESTSRMITALSGFHV